MLEPAQSLITGRRMFWMKWKTLRCLNDLPAGHKKGIGIRGNIYKP